MKGAILMKSSKLSLLLTVVVIFAAISSIFAAGNFPMPTICDRACWSARAPQCAISQEPGLTRAVIHHTAGTADYDIANIEEAKARVRAIQNYHMDVNGWCDIGYHFLADKFGDNFEGREGSISSYPRGAHDGVNTQSFGFNCMGYFHDPYNQQPTTEQRNAMYDVIAWKMPDPFTGLDAGAYGSKTSVGFICGHRDVVATACPGDLLYNPYIGTNVFGGEARVEVYTRIFGSAPPPPPAAPSNLTAVAVSSSQINLAWQDNSDNETNFVIERKTSTGSYAVIATVGANVTSYNNTGLKKNTTYYYRVKAINAAGSSAYSNEASAKTPR